MKHMHNNFPCLFMKDLRIFYIKIQNKIYPKMLYLSICVDYPLTMEVLPQRSQFAQQPKEKLQVETSALCKVDQVMGERHLM